MDFQVVTSFITGHWELALLLMILPNAPVLAGISVKFIYLIPFPKVKLFLLRYVDKVAKELDKEIPDNISEDNITSIEKAFLEKFEADKKKASDEPISKKK